MQRVWIMIMAVVVVLGSLYWFYGRGGAGTASVYNTDQPLLVPPTTNENTSAPQGTAVGEPNQYGPINNQPVNPQKIMQATFHTSKGDITIVFNPETPNTTANFVKLAQSGFYDNTKFHRVIKGFMNQGGDPLSKDDSQMEKWGTGGPGYQFADEITTSNKNDPGTVAMANAGPDTNGSQFFFNVAPNNFLDTKHTVFGKVAQGLEVVETINSVKTGTNDRPVEPVIIKSITIQ